MEAAVGIISGRVRTRACYRGSGRNERETESPSWSDSFVENDGHENGKSFDKRKDIR